MGMQKQISEVLKQRQELSVELERVKENFKKVKTNASEKDAAAMEGLEESLTLAQQELDKKSQVAEQLQRDMEAKLNETSQFTQLRKDLQKKNMIIKDLRSRLSKYESPDDDIQATED